ncbi:MAG: hypothetical protein JWP27_2283 [Flaviaesturariibacter sp.]|nr:hypothetical protein [Flaviaesturariibacter sp.]
MKTGLLVLAMALAASQANSQKLATAKIPAAVKAAFARAHPGTTATWEKEDGNFEAVYRASGTEASCVITPTGNILETETAVSPDKMPPAVMTYIRQHYKGKKIRETARIERASGEVVYEVAVGGKDILFDTNGKLIKSAKD